MSSLTSKTIPIAKLADLVSSTGGLSKPSKMPGSAYSIPAHLCKTGAKLRKIKGSVCSKCYALKGRYSFSNVQDAMNRRYSAIFRDGWVDNMTELIKRQSPDYFRWHDSGDLQGLWHLSNIVKIAKNLPDTKFWLPTREKKMVREWLKKYGPFPANLVVRVSGAMIDGPPPTGFPNTSTVVSKGETCPAPKQDGKCGNCRACWNSTVANVSYRAH